MKANYAFNPIAEQDLRSIQTIVPQRVNAALDLGMKILGKLAAVSAMALIFENDVSAMTHSFEPADARFEAATQEYREIWSAHGARIEKLLEEATGASLSSERITVVVFEGISSSGELGKPMRMRASYAPAVKRATLVHELTHRYLDSLNLDLSTKGVPPALPGWQ